MLRFLRKFLPCQNLILFQREELRKNNYNFVVVKFRFERKVKVLEKRKNPNRMNRIDEEFKKELSFIIDRDLKNPNITGMISVTKVKVSKDLHFARVYVSLLNSKSKKNTLDGLKNSSGFIRSELAKRINLRYTPELVFELDDSLEYGDRIENILKDIMPKD